MVDCLRKMTAKKSCICGKCGSFELLLFSVLVAVVVALEGLYNSKFHCFSEET